MLSYYLNNTNSYTIRTENTASNQYTMSLQDMITQTNTPASLVSSSFTSYENLLAFTASINDVIVGDEFRSTIFNGSDIIWNGSLQVFASQSEDKTVYENKNTQYISHTSENQYIIY